MRSDFAQTWMSALTTLQQRDPQRRRFGARGHHYVATPAYTAHELAALEADLGQSLPAAYRTFVSAVASGGAGPYYGLIRLAGHAQWPGLSAAGRLPSQLPSGREEQDYWGLAQAVDPWLGALPLAELGCGYVALLVVNGPARGEIWLDARAAGMVAPLASGLEPWLDAWLTRMAQGVLPLGYVPSGACGLPHALAMFLANWERRLGVGPGGLAAAQVHQALATLAPGAIVLSAEMPTPLYPPDARLAPCVVCAQLLAQHGLPLEVCAA